MITREAIPSIYKTNLRQLTQAIRMEYNIAMAR